MAGETKQPTFIEEPKIPTDDKTPSCPVPNPPESKSWPELVGLPAEEAAKKIKEEIPGIEIQVLRSNSGATLDFQFNRVRLFVDCEGKVEQVPTIG